MKNKVIEFLNKYSSKSSSKFLGNAIFRKKNKYWLKYSRWVAIKIIATLERNDMSISEFAKSINVSEDIVKKMISGNYNFTLRELATIEKLLKINLLLYE